MHAAKDKIEKELGTMDYYFVFLELKCLDVLLHYISTFNCNLITNQELQLSVLLC
jgi:hypothetical protein